MSDPKGTSVRRVQRVSAHDQNAFLGAYEFRCVYCNSPLDHGNLQIDHVLPQSLADKPAQYARTREEHGLPEDFDLHADTNKVAACGRCNSRKRDGILSYGILLILNTAATKAPRVSELRERSKERLRTAKLMVQVAAVVANDRDAAFDLRRLLEENAGASDAGEQGKPHAHTGKGSADIVRVFGSASFALLNWPQETAGHWIDRPEMDLLIEHFDRQPHSCVALLGEPGSGKSALLARVASDLRDADAAFLAIKADLLRRDVSTLKELAESLGLPCSIEEGIRQLAQERPVFLLIDQVDALAELMDQHTARLDALCRLVSELRGIDNVHIILSCRSFEFHHDLRLSALRSTEVSLAKPSWEAVVPVLASAGVISTDWPADAKEVLRAPQHLALFVKQFGSMGQTRYFKSYHAMLEAVLSERVYAQSWGKEASQVLDRIATALSEAEELWLPASKFVPSCKTEIDHLISAGILVSDPSRIRVGFQHQTIFDFCRARAFASGEADLSEYVLRGQDALFLRPTLWSALRYMLLRIISDSFNGFGPRNCGDMFGT